MAEYQAALEGGPSPKRKIGAAIGTWHWLCQQYFASGAFKALDERTRKVRRAILEATFAEPTKPGAPTTFSEFPLIRMTAKAIMVLRDRKADTPEAANGRVKAIRQVFAFGVLEHPEHVTSNPGRDVPYLKTGSQGHHTWTVEEVVQYQRRQSGRNKGMARTGAPPLCGGAACRYPGARPTTFTAGLGPLHPA
jgi:hypothetical protein